MMICRGNSCAILVGAVLSTAALTSTPASANDAGAFLGGVVAAKVVGNMERRTDAEEMQAQAAASQPAPAPAANASPEAQIQQLDKLAAGGYITPEEYKAKKKAIVDGM
mgnify:CR=1 FL=1